MYKIEISLIKTRKMMDKNIKKGWRERKILGHPLF